ncbi:hypothetical protein [Alkaliphilus serpentinus]|uniref:TOBE domain-containing protein n=1 Tax=Alkaliphilus serpentinus TaxID=1482731 RepID=A0A833HPR4_9FIRM|nr:hypothetical protein [Alkaliphilus serpentinus]KAB3531123.1 hypothetical protein F8153_05675 [Alkaliphilus serpentinus]
MKILIDRVINAEEDIFIEFSTDFGVGRAVWNGNRNPETSKEYNVELDITDVLSWGKDVILSKEKQYGITLKEEDVLITGVLEKIYEDGIVDLRFGNSILQLEIEGDDLPMGKYVEVKADSLEVYDANY